MIVHKTNDYSMFSRQAGNRPINHSHVKRLAASMAEVGFDPHSHIVVDIDFEVVDGQHRLYAAQMAGVEVYYSVKEKSGINVNRQFNALNRPWNRVDYLHSYAEEGVSSYVELRDFCINQNIPFSIVLYATGYGTGFNKKAFVEGRMIFDVDRVLLETLEIRQICLPYGNFANKATFLFAARLLAKTNGFSINQFRDKVSYLSAKLANQPTTNDFVKMLEAIYNYKTRGKPLVAERLYSKNRPKHDQQ